MLVAWGAEVGNFTHLIRLDRTPGTLIEMHS
jgi:hypothetical protein